VKITWDEPKRQRNIEKHGLDFAELTVEFFEGRGSDAPSRIDFSRSVHWPTASLLR
jgi:uncharacterized DUF497 family protein